jgi:hypothetical protein
MTAKLLTSPPNSRGRGTSLGIGVAKRLEREIKDEEAPLVSKFVTWRNLLNFVDEGEDLLLQYEDNEELKRSHRGILESSIVLGEYLLGLEGIDSALSELNCTVDDFRAKIEMLRHKDRIWHGDLSPEKAEQLLGVIFNG